MSGRSKSPFSKQQQPMSGLTARDFDKREPMKRPGQPAEPATAYVMPADFLSSHVSGATIAVTGGKPLP